MAKKIKGSFVISKRIKGTSLVQKQMNAIGYWGKKIIFSIEMKNDKMSVMTFQNFHKDVSSSSAQHKRMGKKPKTEFTGPEISNVSYDITLSAALGVKPRDTIDKLEKCCEKGTVEYLVIGGKKVSKNKYRIKSVSETWDEVFRDGKLYQATLSIALEEYV